jgi:streptogramin lyase
MAVDADGNLWAAAMESDELVKVDNRTGKITEYAVPTMDAGPFALDVDTRRNLVWFSEIFTDRIAGYDPSKNTFVEFTLPSAGSGVRRIEIDRNRPNRVWWSRASEDKIGYIEVIELNGLFVLRCAPLRLGRSCHGGYPGGGSKSASLLPGAK